MGCVLLRDDRGTGSYAWPENDRALLPKYFRNRELCYRRNASAVCRGRANGDTAKSAAQFSADVVTVIPRTVSIAKMCWARAALSVQIRLLTAGY
jgi:hypothetical protein